MKTLFLNIFVFFCMTTHIAAQDFASRFGQIVQRMDTERYRPFSLIMEMNAENLQDSLIPLLKQYETFPNSLVQEKIYQSYFDYGMKSTDTTFKKQMMKNLLNAGAYPDSIELSYACSYSIDLLFQFENNLFDQDVIDTINHRIKNNPRFDLDYAYLSGRLYQYQMIPVFEELLLKETNDRTIYRWHTILARLSNEESINFVRKYLQELSIDTRLLQQGETYAYVRQKPVIDILFDDLESEARGPEYFEPWMEKPLAGSLRAYNVMDILTRLIKDFPVQYRDRRKNMSFTEEELEIARAWAKIHKNDYEIIKE